MNATTQLGEVTSLKTGIRLRRLSVNVWKFGRRTVRPVFSLSEFNSCVEILPARIGMAFGSSWRNRDAAYEGANQESRKAGIVVEAFAAKRLASRRDALQFPLEADATRADSPITLEIDLSARW